MDEQPPELTSIEAKRGQIGIFLDSGGFWIYLNLGSSGVSPALLEDDMKVDQHIIDRSSWDEINIDGWFKALIPPSWEVDDEDEVVIFDPDGFGELNINFLEKMNGKSKKDIANQIISEWAEELGQHESYETSIVKRNQDLLIASSEFIADEPEGEIEYWRIFAVIGKRVALDVSYSCDVEDRNREEQIVEGIIDSIQLKEKEDKPPLPGYQEAESEDSEESSEDPLL
jgi:hypothetical protein